MRRFDPVAFVERHGVVLASARGPVPSIAEAITGEPIRGSGWGHARGGEIFAALETIADSPEVRCFRLVDGKLTFVHRRLWPAVVRLADEIGHERLTAIVQKHTPSGAHKNITTPFARWVTPELRRAARLMSIEEARARLGISQDRQAVLFQGHRA
jgi:hypothetical protein